MNQECACAAGHTGTGAAPATTRMYIYPRNPQRPLSLPYGSLRRTIRKINCRRTVAAGDAVLRWIGNQPLETAPQDRIDGSCAVVVHSLCMAAKLSRHSPACPISTSNTL